MTDEKNGASSTDDILDQLADELGVDENEAASADEESTDADESAPAKESRDEQSTPVAGTPSVAASADDAPTVSNEDAIGSIFSGAGKETAPGDHTSSAAYDPSMDEPVPRPSNPTTLAITAAVLVLITAVGYFTLKPELRADAIKLLNGQDIIELREQRELARLEEEHRQRMANMPKFGTLEIITAPANMLVTSEGQDDMIFPGSRTDVTYPTRSRLQYQDIPVDQPFTFTIHGGGNFADKVVTLQPFGDISSPWIQSYGGDYSATVTYQACWPGEDTRIAPEFCLVPATDTNWRARELRWRDQWRPDPETADPDAPTRLLGSITITSEPAGALIAFNGRQLLNEETGEPHRTPYTFDVYNAPADRVNEEGEPDRTPDPVYLSREGIPLAVLHEGKARALMGVYSHQFLCSLKEGAEAPAAPTGEEEAPSWLGLCDYGFSAHMVLRDPPPPEGSGEGSGEGSADAATEGEAADEGEGEAGE